MSVKTVGDLRRILKGLPDYFEIELRRVERLNDEELKNMIYPYPYRHFRDIELRFHDVGVSDKVLCLGVHKKECEGE